MLLANMSAASPGRRQIRQAQGKLRGGEATLSQVVQGPKAK